MNAMIQICLTIIKNKDLNAILLGYNAKISSKLSRLYLDLLRPLEYSTISFIFY